MGIASFEFVGFVLLAFVSLRLLPVGWRWVILLALSMLFYASFSPSGIPALVIVSLVVWWAAQRIQRVSDDYAAWLSNNRKSATKDERRKRRSRCESRKKLYVSIAAVACIGALFVCKYYGPLARFANEKLGAGLWTAEGILIPLGISYYSLQLMGYLLDVKRGIVHAEGNPLKVVLYGSFFLSIMQGPFNRYADLMPQLCEHNEKFEFDKRRALVRILGGYIKKLCIADQVAIISSEVYGNYSQYHGLGVLLGVVCFAVQLYADFSGYMDIVVGVGELLGIRLPENFRQPFFSRSISEFWQKWHITLGSWLKDYVFYPLLKSEPLKGLGKWLKPRLGKKASRTVPTYVGMLVLWTLIGVWHGATPNYVFSVGILQFLYIFTGEIAEPVFERTRTILRIDPDALLWRGFQAMRTTFLMLIAWVFFNSQTIGDGARMLANVFAPFSLSQISQVFSAQALISIDKQIMLTYITLCAVLLLVIDLIREKGQSVYGLLFGHGSALCVLVFGTMVLCLIVFGAYGAQYNASNFIYFEF